MVVGSDGSCWATAYIGLNSHSFTQGGIEIETAGQFKDLLHKLEAFFVTKYMRENQL
jgi:hypothetical protein